MQWSRKTCFGTCFGPVFRSWNLKHIKLGCVYQKPENGLKTGPKQVWKPRFHGKTRFPEQSDISVENPCFLIFRKMGNKISGFSKRCFHGFEEIDLSWIPGHEIRSQNRCFEVQAVKMPLFGPKTGPKSSISCQNEVSNNMHVNHCKHYSLQ